MRSLDPYWYMFCMMLASFKPLKWASLVITPLRSGEISASLAETWGVSSTFVFVLVLIYFDGLFHLYTWLTIPNLFFSSMLCSPVIYYCGDYKYFIERSMSLLFLSSSFKNEPCKYWSCFADWKLSAGSIESSSLVLF